jgi:hypothetical protein
MAEGRVRTPRRKRRQRAANRGPRVSARGPRFFSGRRPDGTTSIAGKEED